MHNFWLIFKISIIDSFGLNYLKKKFARNSFFLRVIMPIITVLLGLGLLALIIFYMQGFAVIFVAANNPRGLLKYGIALGILICFITTISKANAYLFASKDYDLLMSLPINPKAIIASKFASLLTINYAFFGLTYIPTIFWYSYYYKPGITFYLISLLLLIIGPFLIITICSITSYFVGILLSKFKYRNIIQTVALIIVFVIIMLFSFSFNAVNNIDPTNEMEAIKAIANKMESIAEAIYYPSIWMTDAILGNILSLIIVLLISIIPFITFIYVVGQNFVQANARARVSYTEKNFKLREQKVASQLKTLINREVKRYLSSSALVLNTIVGPIMGTIAVIMLLFSQNSLLQGIGQGHIDKSLIVAIIIGVTTFMNGMISTTASSISLEGKQFWIIKSAPVTVEKVFISKIMINLFVALPFTIFNTIVVSIVLKPEILEVILLFCIPLIVNLIMGMLGLYINLVFPKLNWTNEVKVVKQSLSMVLTMFTGMLFVIGIAALFVEMLSLGINIAYLLIVLLLFVVFSLEVLLLKNNGKKLYSKLSA